MSDEDLKTLLQRAYRSTETEPPNFEATWEAATARARPRLPYRAIAAGLAIIAVAALVSLNQWPATITDSPDGVIAGQDDAWIETIDASLLNATAWSAPSDALLPENEPDIFNSLPTLFESTETEVDALL